MSPRSPTVLRLLVLAWWLCWTMLIVPGHTRGLITLSPCPACQGSTAGTPLLFGSLPTCGKCASRRGSPTPPPAQSTKDCAICHIVAHTTTSALPTPIDSFLRLLAVVPVVPAPQRPALAAFQAYLCRAPPAA